MTQENIIKILAGANKIARESTNIIQEKSAKFVEENIIRGHYVLRQEHEQLKNLVEKLYTEIEHLKQQSNTQSSANKK